jgi:hypothetical protein
MTDIKSRVTTLWLEASKVIAQRFGLEAPPVPESVEVISGITKSRIGGDYTEIGKELLIVCSTQFQIRYVLKHDVILLLNLPDNC